MSVAVLTLVVTGLQVLAPARGPHIRHWALSLAKSQTLSAPATFGLAGVSWPATSKAPTAVKIRASKDGTHWGKWSTVDYEADVGPDKASTEGGTNHATEPVWVGYSKRVQVRFVGNKPAGAQVQLVDPGPDPSPPPGIAQAGASVSQPTIITRAQWGADESMRRDDPEYASSLKFAVVHHTATADSYSTSESDDIIRSIYAYHVQSNGWDDIGYNFLVDRFGRIYEGRYGGITRNVIGAHAQGFNNGSTGISVIGTFQSAGVPSATQAALEKIIAWRLDRGWVDPSGTNTYTSGGSNKYPQGTKVNLHNVIGHKDVGQTSCPGTNIYGLLSWLRTKAHSDSLPKLFNLRRTSTIITPGNGDGILDAIRILGDFNATMRWKVELLNYADTVLHTWSGTAKSFNVRWDGKDDSGNYVPQDTYAFRVSGNNSQGSIRTEEQSFRVWRYPNGILFREGTAGTAWMLKGGKLQRLSSSQALASRYRTAETIITSSTIEKLYPIGGNIGFRDGSVVNVSGKLYFISDQKKRPTTAAALTSLGIDPDSAINASSSAVSVHPTGSNLGPDDNIPNGAALLSDDGSMEAWMIGGIAHPFMSSNIRNTYVIRDIDRVSGYDNEITLGALSSQVPVRDGTLVRVIGGSTIFLIADGQRHRVSSRSMSVMDFKSSNVMPVTQAELFMHPEGYQL